MTPKELMESIRPGDRVRIKWQTNCPTMRLRDWKTDGGECEWFTNNGEYQRVVFRFNDIEKQE